MAAPDAMATPFSAAAWSAAMAAATCAHGSTAASQSHDHSRSPGYSVTVGAMPWLAVRTRTVIDSGPAFSLETAPFCASFWPCDQGPGRQALRTASNRG